MSTVVNDAERLKEELSPARELMNRVLREGEPIAPEYPLIFREGFPGRVVSLGDADGVRSACTVLVRELITPHTTLRVGLIGSVSTDPAFRQNGLATRVVQAAEEALYREGCSLALLWADDQRFYVSRGYRPVAGEDDYVLAPEVASLLPAPEGVRPAHRRDRDAIHGLYARHDNRVARTLAETEVLLECPGMRTAVCERDGEVVAYACIGRGRDMSGTIHEWGGEATDVLRIVRTLLAEREAHAPGAETYLMAPLDAVDLRRELAACGVRPRRGILGLAKLLDRGAVARQIDALAGGEGRLAVRTGPGGETRVTVSHEDETVELNDDTLLVLLLSPEGVRDDIVGFGENFQLDVSKLPLTPFVWGLDSI